MPQGVSVQTTRRDVDPKNCPPRGGLTVEELKAMTAMRLAQDQVAVKKNHRNFSSSSSSTTQYATSITSSNASFHGNEGTSGDTTARSDFTYSSILDTPSATESEGHDGHSLLLRQEARNAQKQPQGLSIQELKELTKRRLAHGHVVGDDDASSVSSQDYAASGSTSSAGRRSNVPPTQTYATSTRMTPVVVRGGGVSSTPSPGGPQYPPRHHGSNTRLPTFNPNDPLSTAGNFGPSVAVRSNEAAPDALDFEFRFSNSATRYSSGLGGGTGGGGGVLEPLSTNSSMRYLPPGGALARPGDEMDASDTWAAPPIGVSSAASQSRLSYRPRHFDGSGRVPHNDSLNATPQSTESQSLGFDRGSAPRRHIMPGPMMNKAASCTGFVDSPSLALGSSTTGGLRSEMQSHSGFGDSIDQFASANSNSDSGKGSNADFTPPPGGSQIGFVSTLSQLAASASYNLSPINFFRKKPVAESSPMSGQHSTGSLPAISKSGLETLHGDEDARSKQSRWFFSSGLANDSKPNSSASNSLALEIAESVLDYSGEDASGPSSGLTASFGNLGGRNSRRTSNPAKSVGQPHNVTMSGFASGMKDRNNSPGSNLLNNVCENEFSDGEESGSFFSGRLGRHEKKSSFLPTGYGDDRDSFGKPPGL